MLLQEGGRRSENRWVQELGLTGLSAGQLRKRTAPSERCVFTSPAWGCSPALVPAATLSVLLGQ